MGWGKGAATLTLPYLRQVIILASWELGHWSLSWRLGQDSNSFLFFLLTLILSCSYIGFCLSHAHITGEEPALKFLLFQAYCSLVIFIVCTCCCTANLSPKEHRQGQMGLGGKGAAQWHGHPAPALAMCCKCSELCELPGMCGAPPGSSVCVGSAMSSVAALPGVPAFKQLQILLLFTLPFPSLLHCPEFSSREKEGTSSQKQCSALAFMQLQRLCATTGHPLSSFPLLLKGEKQARVGSGGAWK